MVNQRRWSRSSFVVFAAAIGLLAVTAVPQARAQTLPSPAPTRPLPAHLSVVDLPAEVTEPRRPEWSPDGRSLFFLSGADLWRTVPGSGTAENLTTGFDRYLERATFLSNGDLLLCARNGDGTERTDGSLWVMQLATAPSRAPSPLGVNCWEGQAVSRAAGDLSISWAESNLGGALPQQLLAGRGVVSRLMLGQIGYGADGIPVLRHARQVLDGVALGAVVEPQDFRGSGSRTELIFSGYGVLGLAEVLGLNLRTGAVLDYSRSLSYEEPEGIAPDGSWTLVERARPFPGAEPIDLWKLSLDGAARWERLTFAGRDSDNGAGNGVVAPDGRRFAYAAATGTEAGAGEQLLIFDLDRWASSPDRRSAIELDRLPITRLR